MNLRSFVQLGIEVFSTECHVEMTRIGTEFLILDETQIRFFIDPLWLRPGGSPKEINIRNRLRAKGIKIWGMARGCWVFYRGDKPRLGEKWHKQIFSGIRRIRPYYIMEGEQTGGSYFGMYQLPPYEPKANDNEEEEQ